jgi:hypothetical protein
MNEYAMMLITIYRSYIKMGDVIQVHLTWGYLKAYDIRISHGSLNHPVKFTIILNTNTL